MLEVSIKERRLLACSCSICKQDYKIQEVLDGIGKTAGVLLLGKVKSFSSLRLFMDR